MRCKKIIALALCLLMLIAPMSVIGCSKDETSSDDNSDKINTSNQSVTKSGKITNVYRTNSIEIPEDIIINIGSIIIRSEKIYALGVKNSDNVVQQSLLVSMDMDGSNLSFEPINPPDSEDDGMVWHINYMCILSDDSKVYSIARYNTETSANECRLIKTDSGGNEIFNLNLYDVFSDSGESGGLYITQMCADSNDMIYIASDNDIAVLNSDGSKNFELDLNSYIEGLYLTQNGKAAVKYYENEPKSSVMRYIDTGNKAIGQKTALPQEFISGQYQIISGSEYDFYLKNNIGIYGYNEGEDKPKELLNFVNSSVNPNLINSFYALPDSKFLCSFYDIENHEETSLAVLDRVPDNEIKEKTIITLGFIYDDYSQYYLFNDIINFNLKSDTYCIQPKDYSIYNTPYDYKPAVTALNNDITTGNVPDILLLYPAEMPVKSYEDKGLFADLYEIMDNDPEFDREDLLRCLRVPFENDGRLFRIGTSFNVQTIVGKSKNLGDRAGWTTSEMMDFAQSLPEDTQLFENMTRENFMNIMLSQVCEFIDYENGTCSFDSDGFINLLKYAKSLPEKIEQSIYEYDTNEDFNAPYCNDKIMLTRLNISSFEQYLIEKARFGIDEELNMIGFPTEDGSNGSVIMVSGEYAISAKSKSKEGAWEFIKYMMSDELQNRKNSVQKFPSTVSALERLAENQMAQYYFYSKSGRWESSDAPFDDKDENSGTRIYLTQDDVDAVKALLDSITVSKSSSSDVQIMNIINEETSAYFNGVKSAEEVADIIQGRISIYLSEIS